MTRLNVEPWGKCGADTRSFGAALTLTSLSTFSAMLAYSGPLGNAATVTAALSASPASTMWILSSMSTGLAISLLTAGALADQSGRRKVFTLGAWIFAAGCLLCATAPGAVVFVLGRLIEGLGAAGMIATGLGLLTAVTDHPRARSVAASWWGASMGLGIAIGPLLTGLFDLTGLWQAPYWLLTALAVGIALAARRCFPETAPIPGARLDLPGGVFMTGGVGSLLVSLIQLRQGSHASALIYAGIAVSMLTAFTLSQLRGRSPMLDLTLFRRTDFTSATIAATATGAGVIALMSFACTFLVTSMGMSTLAASCLLVLWSGTSAVSAVLTQRFTTRITGSTQLALSLALTGAGLLLLTGLTPSSTVGQLAPGLFLAGLATGVLNAGLGRQATATVPPELAAVGVGMNNTTRYVAASIGVTVVAILAAPGADTTTQFSGWNHATLLTGLISLTAAALVLTLNRRPNAGGGERD